MTPTKPEMDQAPVDWFHMGDKWRMHWYDRPGGGWTLPGALPYTISEITVHWSEEKTPGNMPDDFYLGRLAGIARFHSFDRDWEPAAPGIQGGNGIMYHYAIAPTGAIFQVSPETLRTWNSFESNARNLAVCLLAGHGDPLYPAAVGALRSLLNWLCFGRGEELPLVKPTRQTVTVTRPDGHTRDYLSYGVLTHDESLRADGRVPKGCPGIYAPVVSQWRALAAQGQAG